MTRSFGLDAASALRALTDDARKFADGEFRDELNVVLARDCAIKAWHLCEHAFQVATAGVKWHEIGQVENAAIAGWTRAVPWPLGREEDEISKRC